MDLKKYYCESEPLNLTVKKLYNEKVKTTSYEIHFESKPYENDVRNPKFDWFLSHYKRLGDYEDEQHWATTTEDMLSQRFKEEIPWNPNKKLLSYYTYNDELEYFKREKNPCASINTTDEYVTTMQNSYKPKEKFLTTSLDIPEIPFLTNRKFKIENPEESRNKFFDDDHKQEIKLLQEYKPNRLLSYNFMTGLMSDGTVPSKNVYI